ncbi:MAG: DUF3419 domain-containing protein [Planctomycetes bacterium]|nr:DUF3419 domain-containing protein [Planctomycetota bacterium]
MDRWGDLKFAVVREDPEVESALVKGTGARSILLVASGGCTALTLAGRFPHLAVTAFDRSEAQLAHVRVKEAAALRGDLGALNVEDPDPAGLNQRGAFEALFRQLRAFLEEFVAGPGDLARFFRDGETTEGRAALLGRWTASPYWAVAFRLHFHDELLRAMFGPEAVQHAAPGSYPAWFQRVFEVGLAAPGAARNPFLQHVLLGCYRDLDAPPYAGRTRPGGVALRHGVLEEVPGAFDLYSLSNLCDWAGDDEVRSWARHLAFHARPGAVLVVRSLNNDRPLEPYFEPHFAFDRDLGRRLLAADRSLFYGRIRVGRRTDAPVG